MDITIRAADLAEVSGINEMYRILFADMAAIQPQYFAKAE